MICFTIALDARSQRFGRGDVLRVPTRPAKLERAGDASERFIEARVGRVPARAVLGEEVSIQRERLVLVKAMLQ